MEQKLNSLTFFLSEQRKAIENNKAELSDLSERRLGVSELLDMDRGEFSLILSEQDELQKSDKVKDLGIGFIIGVVASLVASLLLDWINRRRDRHA